MSLVIFQLKKSIENQALINHTYSSTFVIKMGAIPHLLFCGERGRNTRKLKVFPNQKSKKITFPDQNKIKFHVIKRGSTKEF